MKIKIGDIVELSKTKELRPDYRGAKLKVKELNFNGTAYHSGEKVGAGFDTLFLPSDVKAIVGFTSEN